MDSITRLIFHLPIFVAVLSAVNTGATSSSTPAQSANGTLTIALRIFVKNNGGELPRSWGELDRFLLKREIGGPKNVDHSNLFRQLERDLGMKVESWYPIVSDKAIQAGGLIDDQPAESAKFFSVGALRIKEDRRASEGRYVIVISRKGEVRSGWVDEQKIQERFLKAGFEIQPRELKVQPETFEKRIERLAKEFSEENFIDPAQPSEQEIQAMSEYFSGLDRTKPTSSNALKEASAPDVEKVIISESKDRKIDHGRISGFRLILIISITTLAAALLVYILRRS